MIQNTASALATGLSQAAGGTTTGAAPAGDFAALLAVTVTPEPALHTGEAASAPVTIRLTNETQPLPDALQDAQDGMTALARQAAATKPDDHETPVIMRSVPVSILPSASVNPPVSALPASSRIALAVGLATMQQGPVNDAPVAAGQLVPGSVTRRAAASSSEPRDGTVPAPARTVAEALYEAQPTRTAAPRPRATLSDAATRQVDGKDGKTSGKMLPSMEKPDHLVAAAPSSAPPVPEVPVQQAAAAVPVLLAAQPAPMTMTIPGLMPESSPSKARTEALMPRIVHTTVIAERPSVTPAARNLRFEPIEIVRLLLEGEVASPARAIAAALIASAPAAAPTAPALPEAAAPGRVPIAPAVAPVGQAANTPEPMPVQPMPARSVEALATTQAEPRSTPSSDRPAALPATYPAARSGTAPERPAPRGEVMAVPSAPSPVAAAIAAPQLHAALAEETPLTPRMAEREAASPPPASERRPVTPGAPTPDPALMAMPGGTPAQPGVPASAPAAASEAPRDFDTLVARVADAREAAQPHVVRTAFEHAEFGRVAMQIQPAEGGLSVTLSSRDADFAPAVQAAAASVASGSTGQSDQPRQDAPPQQQGQNGQASAQAQTGFGQSGGQQARADASGQQQRREGGAPAREQDAPQPGTPARAHGEQRQSGVYA